MRADGGRSARPSTSHCPSATASSALNAADVVAAGGGLLVDDAAFTPEWIDAVLLAPRHRRATGWPRMAAAARTLGEPAADETLADLVDRAAEGRNRS